MRTTTTVLNQADHVTARNASTTLLSALAAALLGMFLVLGTGFTPIEAVHNAVHDARHAAGFPCH